VRVFCTYALSRIGNGAGDFNWHRAPPISWLEETMIIHLTLQHSYPLPTALLAILAWLTNFIAGGLFGISSGILTWLIL
jgi:hypothetical protein